MSAMTTSTTNRNVFTAMTLVLMFLLADVFVPSAFPAPELLEEEPTVQHVISTVSPTQDTYIDSDNPADDYAGEDTGLLGVSGTSEGAFSFRSHSVFLPTDTIHSARLDLVCSNSGPTNGLAIYLPQHPSRGMKMQLGTPGWNAHLGGEAGANDGSDRSDWGLQS